MHADIGNKAQRIFETVGIYSLVTFLFLILVTNVLTAQSVSPQEQDCAIHQGPCSKQLGDCAVILDITPKPVKAMKELTFEVTLSEDCRHGVPFVDLSMPGMAMGQNRIFFKEMHQGVYKGTGVIVRCPSGKKPGKQL